MFVAANSQKPKDGSHPVAMADEWIRKMWSIHSVKYYSVFKRKDILKYATILILKNYNKPDIYHINV